MNDIYRHKCGPHCPICDTQQQILEGNEHATFHDAYMSAWAELHGVDERDFHEPL